MRTQSHLKKAAIAFAILLIAILGVVSPARADNIPMSTNLEVSYLTKVITVPSTASTENEVFTFHFAGSGEVTLDENNNPTSDGVLQDGTIKKGDVIPTIQDKTIGGISTEENNTQDSGTTGASFKQAAGQITLQQILNGVSFPHAGVFTYRVTETPGTTHIQGAYVNYSQASYLMKVYVQNGTDGTGAGATTPTIQGVTITREADDDNGDIGIGKVIPEYPTLENSKITYENETTPIGPNLTKKVAGDFRGRNVDGFTFANEYLKGGYFTINKLTRGQYADKTKEYEVTITIEDQIAPDLSAITYQVYGGTDNTESNYIAATETHKQIDGVGGVSDYIAEFSNHKATIQASLKDGGEVVITGVYGYLEPNKNYDNGNGYTNDHRQKFATGLKADMTYTVTETVLPDHQAAGYVNPKDANEDPAIPDVTKSVTTYSYTIEPAAGLTAESEGTLTITGKTTGEETNLYILNVRNDTGISFTGIIVNNLPYIIMIGVPVAVFAILFVRKRQQRLSSK